MPFTCEIKLDRNQLQHGVLTFDSWIAEPWGRYAPKGTAFARVHDDWGKCVLELCGPGALTSKADLKPGDVIPPDTVVACYLTDGEEIIYDRPVCQIVRE